MRVFSVFACASLALLAAMPVSPGAQTRVKTETIRVVPPSGGGNRTDGTAATPAGEAADGATGGASDEATDGATGGATGGGAVISGDGDMPGAHHVPEEVIRREPLAGMQAEAAGNDLPRVYYDPDLLPRPVRRMRAQIIAAAATGEVENLRPVLEANEMMPTLSLGEVKDPILFLKLSSGDPAGREILAILIEVLEAGYVITDPGTPQEMYVWPYFARYPLDALTPPQQVELYKILTSSDVHDMEEFGAYIFYRVGIGPDGTWHFFLSGE